MILRLYDFISFNYNQDEISLNVVLSCTRQIYKIYAFKVDFIEVGTDSKHNFEIHRTCCDILY